MYNIYKQEQQTIQKILNQQFDQQIVINVINLLMQYIGKQQIQVQKQTQFNQQNQQNSQSNQQLQAQKQNQIPRLTYFQQIFFLNGNLKQNQLDKFSKCDYSQGIYQAKSRYKNDFNQIQLLGQGGFGHVFKARNKLDQNIYAIKKVLLNFTNNYLYQKTIKQVTLLSQLNHQNIVRYHQAWIQKIQSIDQIIEDLKLQDNQQVQQLKKEANDWEQNQIKLKDDQKSPFIIFQRDNSQSQKYIDSCSKINFQDQNQITKIPFQMLYIQMEFCDGKTLLQEKKPIEEVKIIKIIRGLLQAIVHIHNKKIIHRDIKPANIFLRGQQIKIGDFGLATTYGQDDRKQKKYYQNDYEKSCRVGTSYYRAPELINSNYNHKIDIFSLGVVLFQLYYPLKTSHQRDKVLTKLTKEGIFPKDFPQKCQKKDLIPYLKRMLCHNSQERPSAQQLLKIFRTHQFVQVLSSITNPNHYQFKQLLDQIFMINNKVNVCGNQPLYPISKTLLLHLGLSYDYILEKNISREHNYFICTPYFLQFIIFQLQKLWMLNGAFFFQLPAILPLRQYISFGTSTKLKYPFQRSMKKLYVTKQGVICQELNDLLTQWMNFVRKYYNGQRKKEYIKCHSLCRIWNGKNYQMRSSYSITYSNQTNYCSGLCQQFHQIYEILSILKQTIKYQQYIKITNVLYIQALCNKHNFSFNQFIKIFNNQKIKELMKQYKQSNFQNKDKLYHQIYLLFGIQHNIIFHLLQGISYKDNIPPYAILQDQHFQFLKQWFDGIQRVCNYLHIYHQYDLSLIPELTCTSLYIWHPWVLLSNIHFPSQQIYILHIQIKIGNMIHRYQQLNIHKTNQLFKNYIPMYLNSTYNFDIIVFMLFTYSFIQIFGLTLKLRSLGFRTQWARGPFPRDQFKGIPYGVQIKKKSKRKQIYRIIDFQQKYQKQGDIDLVISYLQTKIIKKGKQKSFSKRQI